MQEFVGVKKYKGEKSEDVGASDLVWSVEMMKGKAMRDSQLTATLDQTLEREKEMLKQDPEVTSKRRRLFHSCARYISLKICLSGQSV